MSRAKYLHLLEDPEVKRWHQNVARGSRITADVYLRRLGAFCSSHGLSFRDLLQMEERDLKNRMLKPLLMTRFGPRALKIT